MHDVRDMKLAEKGVLKINWVKDFMPAISEISKRFSKEQTFAGKTIAMSIHMEAKTAYLATCLRDAGAEVYATGCNPLSTQDDVAAGLASLGVHVFAYHGATDEEYIAHLKRVLDPHPDLFIDDGGDLLSLLCGDASACRDRVLGGCEETTTGVHRMKARAAAGTLPFPMMNVNDAKCKHYYDNKYGTGQSVWDGIMHTTNLLVAGKCIVVAGYGYCGRGIAMRAKGMGANVIITEIDPIKALEATMDGYRVMPMHCAAKYGDLFVTATGCKDVITAADFAVMKDNVILCNAGHFNVEINLEELKAASDSVTVRRENIEGYHLKDGRTINVLAEGRLVNLASGNGHPAEIMDTSFAVQALSLEYLLQHAGEMKPIVYDVPEEIDEKIGWAKLKAYGFEIDRLTNDQIQYLYG